jgi:large subunit ribosomal protein L23
VLFLVGFSGGLFSGFCKMTESVGQKGIVLESHQVIVRPLVTEKGTHRATRHNQYAFEIHPLATKTDVRRAVEELVNVKVDKVMTQNRKGKNRRYRNRLGKTGDWKKAVVKLDAEHRIDFF